MAQSFPALNFLLVDDDDMLAMEMQAMSHSGVSATIARDGREAARLIDSRDFDAVAVNLHTPGGYDLLERLGADRNGPPVIALAAKGRGGASLEHTLTVAELRGACAALMKPIDAIELVASAIGCVVRRRKPNPALVALQREFESLVA